MGIQALLQQNHTHRTGPVRTPRPDARRPPTRSAVPAAAVLSGPELRTLYLLHGRALLGAMLKVTAGDRARAEDIVQETMLRAWRHPDLRTPGLESARPWLFTVGRRIAIDHWRMLTVRPEEVHDDVAYDRADPADPYDTLLTRHQLRAALTRLDPTHREVVEHIHLLGHSIADTARLLQIPEGTVKSRTHYALRHLRALLIDRNPDPAWMPALGGRSGVEWSGVEWSGPDRGRVRPARGAA
jgi:RNA polymerase sigma-70 factor (ECF subfamily)